MNIRNTILLGFTVACLPAVWCGAATKDVLLSETKTISLPWTPGDGKGFLWDIQNTGCVQSGSNYAYGSGMMLQLQGRGNFYANNNTAVLRADELEIQLGPFTQDKLQVWRRVYIDPKLGYARWIDIFENTDANPLKLDVQYQNHMGNGVQQCVTTTEKDLPEDKDWGFVTDDRSNQRPAVLHIYSSKRGKQRPDVQVAMNNNRILYNMSLTIPPGEARALCFFEAQRNGFDEAKRLMKSFRPERELAKVSKSLRDVIVNMTSDVLLIGRLDIPRSRVSDKIVLQDDAEVNGTILNPSFTVETFFGRLDLPADRVMGLSVLEPNDRFVQVVLSDGQIVGGVMEKAGIKARLDDGKELTLPVHRVATAGYRYSESKPEELSLQYPMLVLRSGQQLRFDPKTVPLEFLTEYGPMQLQSDDLCEIRLANDGRLHQAVFRNGSVVTGLWKVEEIRTTLSLGPQLILPREMLAGVFFHSPGQPDGPIRLTLRNDDVLLGSLADEILPIQTELGKIDVPAGRIRTLQRLDGAPGSVRVQLADETTVSGTLQRPVIRFRISPNVELPVYVGHVVKLQHGTPKQKEEVPYKQIKRLQALVASKENALKLLREKTENLKKRVAQNPNDKELQVKLRKHETWTILIQNQTDGYKQKLADLLKNTPVRQPGS
ncbi:MAG: TMF family protein [Phycisphaerae bacterium]|nr:TMF family protein [Phycisphaerae bacterium]